VYWTYGPLGDHIANKTTIMFANRIIQYLILILFPVIASSQTTLTGKVMGDDGEAIIAGNIYLKNTYDGASSDENGYFEFQTFEKDSVILVVSYLGYDPYERALFLEEGGKQYIDIQLEAASNELDMVVITAGAFEASDEKKAVVLRPVDIVTTAGATGDLYGALNTLPGTQSVAEDGRLFVRGGAAYETRTFIDGMLVQTPYNSTVPDVPARGRFSPFLFKGTTFSTGGYSAEYGQALSSALILETQDLAPETVTGISLMSVGLGISHTERWEKSSLAASVDHTNLAPYVGLVDQNIEWNQPFQAWSGQAIFRQQTSETGMLKVQGSGSYNTFTLQYPDATNVEQRTPLSLDNANYMGHATYRELFGEKWTFFSGLSYAYDQEDIAQNFNVNTNEQTFQSKSTLTYQWSEELRIKGGVEWWHNAVAEDYRAPDAQRIFTHLQENYGATFVEADAYLSKKLVARAGLRFEYSALLQQYNWAPRLSVAYKTGKKSQVSFAFGRFYQNPERESLRYNTAVGFEQADHYILNYQYINNGRTFRAEAYHKQYDHLLRYPSATPWLSENTGNGYARGIDVFFRDRTSIYNGDYWLSYSYLDTKRNFRDFPVAATPTFASAHNLSAVYKHWVPQLRTQFGATYSFASGRPFNDPNEEAFNGGRTRAFHDLSLNASYLTNWFGQFTIVHVSATNVLGIDQVFGYRFSNQPGVDGQFTSMAIRPPAKRFFFVGIFMSIGQKFKATSNSVNL
jgi:vitamin B12 transporter